jgi:hypothetical protein
MRALITLLALAAFATIHLVRAADPTPSSTPEASASPTKKYSKKSTTAANANPAPSPTASASPAKVAKTVPTPQAAQAPGGGAGQVWVNTETHVRKVQMRHSARALRCSGCGRHQGLAFSTRALVNDLLRNPAPYTFVGRHCAVGDFHKRIA